MPVSACQFTAKFSFRPRILNPLAVNEIVMTLYFEDKVQLSDWLRDFDVNRVHFHVTLMFGFTSLKTVVSLIGT